MYVCAIRLTRHAFVRGTLSEKQLLNQQSKWPLVNGAAESGNFGLDVCYINHFIGLLKTFPFIVIILRYRAHKSVHSSSRPSPSHFTAFSRLLLCFIPIQSLVSELIMGSTGRLSHIFLNFSLLLTCWAPLLLMATTTGTLCTLSHSQSWSPSCFSMAMPIKFKSAGLLFLVRV